jgi:hypothetical protein
MPSQIDAEREIFDSIRRERAALVEQIRSSEKTIESSKELIRRMDELLAKAGQKKD